MLLNLGTHMQEGYSSWSVCLSLCVSVSVCLSVKSHLTSGASVRPENTVTYSKNCGVFSETASLQRSSTASIERPYMYNRPFFLWKVRIRITVFTTWWRRGFCTLVPSYVSCETTVEPPNKCHAKGRAF